MFAFPPQPPVAPLALEPADVAAVGLDFVPNSFVGGVVKKDAVLVSREGDFGFSQENGTPEAGHDIELVNFSQRRQPSELELSRFAFNCARRPTSGTIPDGTPRCAGETDQAFDAKLRGINRPITIRFGPDGARTSSTTARCATRRRRPALAFRNPANAPLVQIPGTGMIWKISRIETATMAMATIMTMTTARARTSTRPAC